MNVDRYGPGGALLVVDVQHDFADPAGSLYVTGAESVVAAAAAEIARARAAGSLVVYTQDWHPPDTPHFQKDGGLWPVHCVADSWGAGFADGLPVEGDVVRKGVGGEDGYSGFTLRDPVGEQTASTGLAELLREHDVERVVVVGLATDYCVVETAVDATAAGFDTTVLRDAIAAVDVAAGDGDRAIQRMAAAGVHIDTTA